MYPCLYWFNKEVKGDEEREVQEDLVTRVLFFHIFIIVLNSKFVNARFEFCVCDVILKYIWLNFL